MKFYYIFVIISIFLVSCKSIVANNETLKNKPITIEKKTNVLPETKTFYDKNKLWNTLSDASNMSMWIGEPTPETAKKYLGIPKAGFLLQLIESPFMDDEIKETTMYLKGKSKVIALLSFGPLELDKDLIANCKFSPIYIFSYNGIKINGTDSYVLTSEHHGIDLLSDTIYEVLRLYIKKIDENTLNITANKTLFFAGSLNNINENIKIQEPDKYIFKKIR